MADPDEWKRHLNSHWKGKERDDSLYMPPTNTSTNNFTFPSFFTSPTAATCSAFDLPPFTPRFPAHYSPSPASSSSSSSSSSGGSSSSSNYYAHSTYATATTNSSNSSSSTTAGSSSYPHNTGSNSNRSSYYSSLASTPSTPASRSSTSPGALCAHWHIPASSYTPNTTTNTELLGWSSPLISNGYTYAPGLASSTRTFFPPSTTTTTQSPFNKNNTITTHLAHHPPSTTIPSPTTTTTSNRPLKLPRKLKALPTITRTPPSPSPSALLSPTPTTPTMPPPPPDQRPPSPITRPAKRYASNELLAPPGRVPATSLASRYHTRTTPLFDRLDNGYNCHRWTNFDRGLDDNDVKMEDPDDDEAEAQRAARRLAARRRHATI
ncbi:hypothetical protein B0T22DRAFT_513525 [Podospora appendiculata]|uniref:Uncharacterized protein n=1 Tax=Podospora appendiculata TaxID=314037 RepID=A0AAE0XBJ6_9PEZI|nr:hypothetical protein B0T22DRAFT_513525 [Podospora appendiculata]